MRFKSFLLYYGGKYKLSTKIEELLPDMKEIDTIVSPFFGSGAFEYYLLSNYDIKLEGYDIEPELVNYHKCLVENPKKLYTEIMKYFEFPLSKDEFMNYRDILTGSSSLVVGKNYSTKDKSYKSDKKKTLNLSKEKTLDLSKKKIVKFTNKNKYYYAAILFGLSRNSYSGKVRSFAKKPSMINISKMNDFIFPKNKIKINKKDCFAVLDKYKKISKKKSDSTLIYIDPPYCLDDKPNLSHYGISQLQKPFDHEKLCNLLKKIKTRWLLSYNNSEIIMDLYKDFNIYSTNVVYLRYTSKETHSDDANEIIICNYDAGI